MNIKEYQKRVLSRLEKLSDETFIKMVEQCGINDCPFIEEITVEGTLYLMDNYITHDYYVYEQLNIEVA